MSQTKAHSISTHFPTKKNGVYLKDEEMMDICSWQNLCRTLLLEGGTFITVVVCDPVNVQSGWGEKRGHLAEKKPLQIYVQALTSRFQDAAPCEFFLPQQDCNCRSPSLSLLWNGRFSYDFYILNFILDIPYILFYGYTLYFILKFYFICKTFFFLEWWITTPPPKANSFPPKYK